MSADFVLTETDELVAVSFAGRTETPTGLFRGPLLECFNLDNALSLRAALEMGMEVRCVVPHDSSLCDDAGVLTLAHFDELMTAGRVVVGNFCATVELGDLMRLQLDSAPDGVG